MIHSVSILITKPDNTQQTITTMVVHDTFCITDKNGCKDNIKQNITTLAVCDTSHTFCMKPYNIQQNMTTTAGKTTQNKTTCGMSNFTHCTT